MKTRKGLGICVVVGLAVLLAWLTISPAMAEPGVTEPAGAAPLTGYLTNLKLARAEVLPGLDRSYDLYVPTNYDATKAYPLVINLHGRPGAPTDDLSQGQEWLCGMSDIAEEAGFLVAYPDCFGQGWSDGRQCVLGGEFTVDDVYVVSRMIDAISARYNVDPKRIYAVGMCCGGKMAYRLGCQLSSRIAAVAGVASPAGVTPCLPAHAMPVLQFYGTADMTDLSLTTTRLEMRPSVFFPGTYERIQMGGLVEIVEQVDVVGQMAAWAERNGCSGETEVIYQKGAVTCRVYKGCADGATVTLCTVEGGGHTWPGGSVLDPAVFGATNADIDASRYIWDFFAAHPMK
jgi:polyhydroxybutyrate depolymerase